MPGARSATLRLCPARLLPYVSPQPTDMPWVLKPGSCVGHQVNTAAPDAPLSWAFTPVVSNHRIRRTVQSKYAIRPWSGDGRVKMHGEGGSRLSLYSPDGRGLGAMDIVQTVEQAPLPRAAGRILYRLESSVGGSSVANETGSASFTGR